MIINSFAACEISDNGEACPIVEGQEYPDSKTLYHGLLQCTMALLLDST